MELPKRDRRQSVLGLRGCEGMMRRDRIALFAVAIALVALVATPGFAAHDGDLQTTMTGEQVVGKGDPDAWALGFITFDEGKNTICYLVSWRKMQRPTATHIHRGARGEVGPIVVKLFGRGEAIKRRSADGCVVVSHAMWQDIQDHPDDYYIDAHNGHYPEGAVRGHFHNDR